MASKRPAPALIFIFITLLIDVTGLGNYYSGFSKTH